MKRHLLRAVLGVLAGTVPMVSMADTFRTAQECREVYRRESDAWSKAYWAQGRCWGEGRCGNPGADPRFKEWSRRNSALLETCSQMAQAEVERKSEEERARRERDRQQEEVYARSRQGTPPSQPRTTVIPYVPPPTPSLNAGASKADRRAAQATAAIGLLGAILSAASSSADVEDEPEEASVPEPIVERLTETPRTAPVVEPPPKPKEPSFDESKLTAHNERSKELFDEAVKRLKYHDAVVKIQDFAWDRLMEKVDLFTSQVRVLEQQVDAIVVPRREQTGYRPGRSTLPAAISYESTPLDYVGDTDEQGRPHGQGEAQGYSAVFKEVLYYGEFFHGEFTGAGTLEREDYGGNRVSIQGKFDKGKAVGPMTETRIASGAGKTVYRGKYDSKGGTLALTYPRGETWRGPVDAKLQPSGHGSFQLRDGNVAKGHLVGTEWKSPVTVTRSSGSMTQCLKFRVQDGLPNCHSDMTRVNFNDGGYMVVKLTEKGDFGYPQVWYSNNGSEAPSIKELFSQGPGSLAYGRQRWRDGLTYEGEFYPSDLRMAGIGIMKYPSGHSKVGRFRGRDLVDGIVYDPKGAQIDSVGTGQKFDVPKFAMRSESRRTPAAPSGISYFVQAGAAQSSSGAEWIVQGLAKIGFTGAVTQGNAGAYRVRVGPYRDEASAKSALERVKGTYSDAALVRVSN